MFLKQRLDCIGSTIYLYLTTKKVETEATQNTAASETPFPLYATMLPLHFLILLLLFSCGADDIKKGVDPLPSNSKIKVVEHDTVLINGSELLVFSLDSIPIALVTHSGDSVIKRANYYQRFTFPDID